MKGLLISIGNKIQTALPPNRVCILLAGPITAASLWLSAWVTSHVPGTTLPSSAVAGGMFLVTGSVVALLYQWYDGWKRGESIDITGELSNMLDEVETKFFSSLGAHEAVKHALADLHGKISRGEVNEAQVAHSIEALHGVVDEFLAEHAPEVHGVPDAAEGVVPNGAAEGVIPAAAAPLEHAAPEAPAAPVAPETPAQ